jgi:hypothetical protein
MPPSRREVEKLSEYRRGFRDGSRVTWGIAELFAISDKHGVPCGCEACKVLVDFARRISAINPKPPSIPGTISFRPNFVRKPEPNSNPEDFP